MTRGRLLNRLESEPSPTLPFEPYATTPTEQYDLNFRFPVFEELRASGVVLKPYIPSLYARLDYDLFRQPEAKEVWAYLPYGPFESFHNFLVWLESQRADPATLLCAVFDTANNPAGQFVGTWGFSNANLQHLTIENSHGRIHPSAQRSHVNSQAVALMLEQSFEVWGIRRFQGWANARNAASLASARRFGFHEEGMLLWHRVLPANKAQYVEEELVVPPDSKLGSPAAGYGRHTVVFSMTWQMWRDGAGAAFRKMKEREPVKRSAKARL